jgi:ERCC4-type nuclease
MEVDLSTVTIAATKPRGKIAQGLAEMGIRVVPIVEDEGNVDRYVLSKRLAVERRTGGGFLKGIMEKTLFTSAIYLREHFAIPVLIVEGKVNYEFSMMTPPAVRGALSSMMILYGQSVLATADAAETVEIIAMMARQEQIGIPDISVIPKRKAATLDDMQRRVIEMRPGCGMVLARDLLQHFGSVQRIARATEEEFRSMRGIGARKAKEICKVLAAEYESVDTEKNLEDAIEADPKLLFRPPTKLLARQHYLFTEGKDRHFIDLVFVDPKANELIIVELKRGRLEPAHEAQLARYLDYAHLSPLLAEYVDKGATLRGLLATVEPCEFKPRGKDTSVQIVDRAKVIKVLKKLRKLRQSAS